MADQGRIRGRIEQPAPTARELALVLFRRRRVFAVAACVVFLATLFYIFAGARYQAEMKVLVRRGRADAPLSSGENAPLDLTRTAMTEEELNSEVELLKDDDLLREVVDKTGLAGHDWLHFIRPGEGRAERVERAARRLGKKLQVEAVKKTNLITVAYAADDPQVAARVLQAIADAYVAKHTIVHRPGGQVHFFEQQSEESRRQLEIAEHNLLDFTSAHNVIEAAQERDLVLGKLSDMDASYRQTQIDLKETHERVLELAAQLAAQPERTTTQVRIADNPELMKALKSNLLDLQQKRIDLLMKFEPTHRLVREVDQQIAQTQSSIAAENAAPLRDETTDKNSHYEWAKSELQHAQVQLKGLIARASETTAQTNSYRAMARQLGNDAVMQEDLVNTEKIAQDNYLLYVKKTEEARMSDALDQRGIVNVAIAEPPVAPALPQFSALMLFAVGLVAAGAAGSGAAFAADHLDPAFRTPEDVIGYLNAPVLASLPRNSQRSLSA